MRLCVMWPTVPTAYTALRSRPRCIRGVAKICGETLVIRFALLARWTLEYRSALSVVDALVTAPVAPGGGGGGGGGGRVSTFSIGVTSAITPSCCAGDPSSWSASPFIAIHSSVFGGVRLCRSYRAAIVDVFRCISDLIVGVGKFLKVRFPLVKMKFRTVKRP